MQPHCDDILTANVRVACRCWCIRWCRELQLDTMEVFDLIRDIKDPEHEDLTLCV